MAGTISSLGVGSSILTQDVLDQLRKADEAAKVTPITLKIADMQDRNSAMTKVQGWMDALATSVSSIASKTLYTERTANVTGSAVSVTADANTDLQSFTIKVNNLATKEINESGSFTAKTDLIASGTGSLNLNIGGTDYTINYDATTTLDDLKKAINTVAGDKVNASIVQLGTNDFRLFMTAVETGDAQNMTITDTSGLLNGTQLTTGMTTVQDGVNASFEFNNQLVSRSSNEITDLVAGLTITLQTAGETSTVDITQNRDAIIEKLNDFVSKYNTAMTEIGNMTKADQDAEKSGIFSSTSVIKSMQRQLQDMLVQLGGGESIFNYGFDQDKYGKLSFDSTKFNTLMDANPANVEAVLSGGTFTNTDGTTKTLTGFFAEYQTGVESYTKYNGILDTFATNLKDDQGRLEDQKALAIERLDKKYDLMAKQFAAYDAMINKINQQSSFLTQMISAAKSSSSSSS